MQVKRERRLAMQAKTPETLVRMLVMQG